VEVAGFDTLEAPNAVRQRIGFLTGTTGLYERITPDEFLNFLRKIYQIPQTTFLERKERLYETLGMQDFRSKRIGKLSSGMKQKVSIARTLIHDPPVLVFDEPTTGLDVITAENIINLIRESKDNGKTVIFSSHIMSEVDLLCDDLAIIHQGRLLYNNSMDHFRQSMESRSLTEEFIKTVNA
jgi:sodium transport system ATP-binding protein